MAAFLLSFLLWNPNRTVNSRSRFLFIFPGETMTCLGFIKCLTWMISKAWQVWARRLDSRVGCLASFVHLLYYTGWFIPSPGAFNCWGLSFRRLKLRLIPGVRWRSHWLDEIVFFVLLSFSLSAKKCWHLPMICAHVRY